MAQCNYGGNAETSAPNVIVESARPPIRERAEDAEILTRHLAQKIREEIDRIKEERRNEPRFQETIDFLADAAQELDHIADQIRAARETASAERKNELFAKADASVRALAEIAQEFATRHRDRLVDFGGHMSVVGFATTLLAIIGVSPDWAFLGVMAMYGLPLKK